MTVTGRSVHHLNLACQQAISASIMAALSVEKTRAARAASSFLPVTSFFACPFHTPGGVTLPRSRFHSSDALLFGRKCRGDYAHFFDFFPECRGAVCERRLRLERGAAGQHPGPPAPGVRLGGVVQVEWGRGAPDAGLPRGT